MRDFDWQDQACVTIPAQCAIAVLEATDGTVEIRQQVYHGSDRDDVIIVAKQNLPALIRRLQEICGS